MTDKTYTAEQVEALAQELYAAPATSMWGARVSVPTDKAAATFEVLNAYAATLRQAGAVDEAMVERACAAADGAGVIGWDNRTRQAAMRAALQAALARPASSEPASDDVVDRVAKAIADAAGHGMREKCEHMAHAAISAYRLATWGSKSEPASGEAVACPHHVRYPHPCRECEDGPLPEEFRPYPAHAGDKCFACGRAIGRLEKERRADTRDGQQVYVGSECYKKIESAGEEGWQPPKGGPRLWPCLHPAEPVKVPDSIPLDDDVRNILGRICYQCIHLANALRRMGHTIEKRAEAEQAAVLHWLLNHYLKHGKSWSEAARAELKAAAEAAAAPGADGEVGNG